MPSLRRGRLPCWPPPAAAVVPGRFEMTRAVRCRPSHLREPGAYLDEDGSHLVLDPSRAGHSHTGPRPYPRRCASLSAEPLAKLSPRALSRASIPMIDASEATPLPPRPGSASSLRPVRRCGLTDSPPPAVCQPTSAPFARAAVARTLLAISTLLPLCWAGAARAALPGCSQGGSKLDAHLDNRGWPRARSSCPVLGREACVVEEFYLRSFNSYVFLCPPRREGRGGNRCR